MYSRFQISMGRLGIIQLDGPFLSILQNFTEWFNIWQHGYDNGYDNNREFRIIVERPKDDFGYLGYLYRYFLLFTIVFIEKDMQKKIFKISLKGSKTNRSVVPKMGSTLQKGDDLIFYNGNFKFINFHLFWLCFWKSDVVYWK